MAFRAASTTAAPSAGRGVRVIGGGIPTPATCPNRYRDSLDDSTVVVTSRVHAIVDGEVAAD